MRILVLAHGLLFRGAQIATLEFLEMLKERVDVRALACKDSDEKLLSSIASMGMKIYRFPAELSMVIQ